MLFWRATLAWVILYSCASAAVEFCALGQGRKSNLWSCMLPNFWVVWLEERNGSIF